MGENRENKSESFEVRNDVIPLPSREDGYRSILMIGTFGAGKSTVIRQLLGTNPRTERFPATNPGKTTVADAEYIVTKTDVYRVVVTFFDLVTIKRHLEENFVAAGKQLAHGGTNLDAYKALFDHHESRFKFSYLYGLPNVVSNVPGDLEEPSSDEQKSFQPQGSLRDAIEEFRPLVEKLRKFAIEQEDRYRQYTKAEGFPSAEAEIYIEDQLEADLCGMPLLGDFLELGIDIVFNRIENIDFGEFHYDQTGWPVSWTFEARQREEFLRCLSWFTSNESVRSGELLFPLVNGVRVSGPFIPAWSGEGWPLVIVDSQGFEHASVGNIESEEMERYDVVTLVDNSTQPMQSAPWERVRHLVTSGNAARARVLFTKFEPSQADGIHSRAERYGWVQSNFLNQIERDQRVYGPAAARLLRSIATDKTFYVGHLNHLLEPDTAEHAFVIEQLRRFIASVFAEDPATSDEIPIPVVSRARIRTAVSRAVQLFRKRWKGYLGREVNNDFPKAHWATMKALTRRMAEGWADEHGHLAPAAQFRSSFERVIFEELSDPVRWSVPTADQASKDSAVQAAARLLQKELRELSEKRIASTKRSTWLEAYSCSGIGSSLTRAKIIDVGVVEAAAPSSDSPDFEILVGAVIAIIERMVREGLVFLVD